MTRTTGTSTWLDLGIHDLDAAKTFYAGLFGWTFEDLGEDFHHYNLIRNNGALVGGVMDVSGMTCPQGEDIPSEWGVFLAVDNADARLAKVTAAGGTVVTSAYDVGDSGRMAVVLDPTGAVIGLWQALELEGYEFTGSPGSPVWFELMTQRFDDAAAFYTAVFDADLIPLSEPMENDDFRYVTNGQGEGASWGIGDARGIMPETATGWRIYLGVAECDAAVDRVRELGGSLLDGPVNSPFGRIATVADPEGASFQICAMSEAAPEG